MYRGYFFAEYARKIEENAGKIGEFSRKIRGKSWNFQGIHSSTSCRMPRFRGHFRSFSQSFPVIPGYDSDSFRFYSFSFLIFKLYYYFCTGIYSINCSYEENYSNFSHHFYGYWR